jgi:hypothetical protein
VRFALAIACAATAAVSCLAVLHWLQDAPDREPPPAVGAALHREPPAVAMPPPAEDASLDGAQLASELARSAEAREEALRAAIRDIGQDESLSLDGRLERYREAVKGQVRPGFDSPSLLTEVFLRMPGVQKELAALGPSARSRELAHIRRELGYDDAGIARMEEIDARREARWENGLAYMQERARVVATFEGGAREDELDALRSEYFGEQAPTIAREERDEFFRFERPRVYGRN